MAQQLITSSAMAITFDFPPGYVGNWVVSGQAALQPQLSRIGQSATGPSAGISSAPKGSESALEQSRLRPCAAGAHGLGLMAGDPDLADWVVMDEDLT